MTALLAIAGGSTALAAYVLSGAFFWVLLDLHKRRRIKAGRMALWLSLTTVAGTLAAGVLALIVMGLLYVILLLV